MKTSHTLPLESDFPTEFQRRLRYAGALAEVISAGNDDPALSDCLCNTVFELQSLFYRVNITERVQAEAPRPVYETLRDTRVPQQADTDPQEGQQDLASAREQSRIDADLRAKEGTIRTMNAPKRAWLKANHDTDADQGQEGQP